MQDINEKEIEDTAKDLLIVSGYRFSVRDIIQGSNFDESGIRYRENRQANGMLENTDDVRKVNEYAFFNRPEPLPPHSLKQ